MNAGSLLEEGPLCSSPFGIVGVDHLYSYTFTSYWKDANTSLSSTSHSHFVTPWTLSEVATMIYLRNTSTADNDYLFFDDRYTKDDLK